MLHRGLLSPVLGKVVTGNAFTATHFVSKTGTENARFQIKCGRNSGLTNVALTNIGKVGGFQSDVLRRTEHVVCDAQSADLA